MFWIHICIQLWIHEKLQKQIKIECFKTLSIFLLIRNVTQGPLLNILPLHIEHRIKCHSCHHLFLQAWIQNINLGGTNCKILKLVNQWIVMTFLCLKFAPDMIHTLRWWGWCGTVPTYMITHSTVQERQVTTSYSMQYLKGWISETLTSCPKCTFIYLCLCYSYL